MNKLQIEEAAERYVNNTYDVDHNTFVYTFIAGAECRQDEIDMEGAIWRQREIDELVSSLQIATDVNLELKRVIQELEKCVKKKEEEVAEMVEALDEALRWYDIKEVPPDDSLLVLVRNDFSIDMGIFNDGELITETDIGEPTHWKHIVSPKTNKTFRRYKP